MMRGKKINNKKKEENKKKYSKKIGVFLSTNHGLKTHTVLQAVIGFECYRYFLRVKQFY